jgi:glycosyltransferase involved in cell wall biosynthesis
LFRKNLFVHCLSYTASRKAIDTLVPAVSIIMNVRNGALFLREALDSVLAQSFQDWELIAWDDRSTDNSSRITAEYLDPRIRYFLSPQDTPLGEARNGAIRQAKGQWLAFLDQDDVWLPGKLQQQMALADDYVGIVYGRAIQFYPSGEERDYDYAHEFQPLPEGDIFTQLFVDGCFIAMSSAVLRRSAVEEIGPIPETIQTVPDYYIYVAVARRYPARAVQGAVCRYRMHAGSMSQSKRYRLYQEPLLIVNQWAEQLDPRIVVYRRMTYSTGLALEEMRSLKTARIGLVRLLTDGSIFWLMSRPFVRAWRAVRRKVCRPYWLGRDFTSDRD